MVYATICSRKILDTIWTMKNETEFFKAYYTRQKDYFIEQDFFSSENYWSKVLKPSKIEEYHFIEIEEKLKFKLPEGFKNFYKTGYSVNQNDFMVVGGYVFEIPGSFSEVFHLKNIEQMIEKDDYDSHALTLVGNPEGANLKYLKQYLFEEDLILHANLLEQGLIPFGIVNHEWHVCLDIKQNKENPPVILYSISFATEQDKARPKNNWFSDFSSFIKCLTDYLKFGNTENFDKIDPGNNYKIIFDF